MTEDSGLSSLSQFAGQRVATAHESVTHVIRIAILSGELEPGTRLVQSELAERLHTSTTPIREALRDLTMEGLVDFDPFRGAIVHTPSVDELRDVYELRRLVTPMCVAKAVPRITDGELDAARTLTRSMRGASTRVEWVELNRRFHRLLDGASGSPPLIAVVGRLADLSSLYVNRSLSDSGARQAAANDEHDSLLEAYERRDVDAAIGEILSHLEATVREALPQISTTASESPARSGTRNGAHKPRPR